MKVIFISMGVQVIFAKALEDLMDMLAVLFHVVEVDEDTYIEHVRVDVIHEALKSCQCISQTKGHNTPFERVVVGVEGDFPFVTFTDSNKVVGMLQVNFGIHRGLLQAVKEVRDMRKQILVFLGNFIEHSKVSTETE